MFVIMFHRTTLLFRIIMCVDGHEWDSFLRFDGVKIKFYYYFILVLITQATYDLD